ncbi:MAG: GNAT family N-acetyltransferase [Anaerolineae bacterium]|nr:GNAT family N-acetyltransferase [Anaerolineae bacterium]
MFHQRNLVDDADVERLKDFLMASRPHGRAAYLHVGDLLWGMRMHTQMNPQRDHRIWFDARGGVAGFARLYRLTDLMMQVLPSLRGTGMLEDEMLAWALAERAGPGAAGEPTPAITTAAAESDTATISWLRSHGFVPNGDDLAILIRPLVDPVERVDLTDGAVVRAVAGEAEYPERVSIHREVWAPSRVTAEGYALTRGAPGYEPELDLAVALPGGTFAAYCVCWLDPVNRVGEFEPVGTRPAYRRKGYGRAVLLEGLRRMRERGMREGLVYCKAHNVDFYQSAGFLVTDQFLGFRTP